jgi:Putative lumazine-binding
MPTTPRLLVLAIAVAAPLASARAQSDQQAVKAVLTRMFDGMRTRDTAMMQSTIVPTTVLERTSATGELGEPIQMTKFIERVGSGTGPGGNEQIKDPKIEIDGPLASVWTYYTYTPGGKTAVDHCGVDAFLLRKGADGWKIFHIADSSRNDGCTPIK